jgi:hypothetical protein
MQAKESVSLSPEQFATVQTVLVFLEAVTTTLETPTRPTEPSDLELTAAVRDLGLYCKDRMLLAFPALAHWRATGDGQ